jgi:hypothetical protein
MNLTLSELMGTLFVALCSAVLGVVWVKLDRTEKTADSNRIALSYLTKSIDKTMQMTERLTSLEAAFRIEIKNLSIAVARLESAMVDPKTSQSSKDRASK